MSRRYESHYEKSMILYTEYNTECRCLCPSDNVTITTIMLDNIHDSHYVACRYAWCRVYTTSFSSILLRRGDVTCCAASYFFFSLSLISFTKSACGSAPSVVFFSPLSQLSPSHFISSFFIDSSPSRISSSP